MRLIDNTGGGKIAAMITNVQDKLLKHTSVTVSVLAPESVQVTGCLPRSKGWHVALDVPLKANKGPYKRKDYIRFLKETRYKEVWIKVSTSGGHSRIYVR
jgi:hypothetical protein